MAKTFKQQVEEIESCRASLPLICRPKQFSYEVCNKYDSCADCHTDRILSAHNAELDRIAEGMPDIKELNKRMKLANQYMDKPLNVIEAALLMRTECQAYIQAQKEGM